MDATGQDVLHEAAKMRSAGLNKAEEGHDVQMDADMVDDFGCTAWQYFEWWRKAYTPHNEDDEKAERAFRELLDAVCELSANSRSRMVLLDSDSEEETRWLVDLERGIGKEEVDVSNVEISV
ncbi:hypothetical protein N0V85_002376 [Neurospora sp. IMI 360204]|nr:hypothetical protein N0V85_002376 [Neurospora sp. IMI 360204]